MKVTQEKLPQSKIKLVIEVEQDEVQPFLDAAAREESKKHPIKGFRPGLVPFDVMRSSVGDHHLIEVALQKLVPKTYVDALLDEKEIEAIGRPEITAKVAEIGKNWIYEAVVATLPEVTLGDYRNLKEEKKNISVDEKEVDEEITELQKMRASYVTVSRPAEKGDKVELDINITADNVPLEDGSARKQSVILGDSHLFPEFEAQITGTRENETKEFPIKFPADHPQKDLQNRTVDFKVKVLTIQQQILPVLDDNFAQGLGKFANITELRKKINENLRLEKEDKEKQRRQQALLDKAVAQTVFQDIPEVLLENETDKMLSEMEGGLAQMGLDWEHYLMQIKKTKEGLRSSFKNPAVKRVKAGLTLREIAKQEKIEVTDEEVQTEVTKLLQSFPSVKEAQKRVDIDALTEITVGTLRNKKVFELLEKIAGT